MSAVASRYARAFADLLFEQRVDAARIAEQLRAVVAWLQQSQPLREVWENPSVPAEQKRAKLLRNFVAVILDHHRSAQLPEIAQQFQEELNQRLGLAEADVTSARELSAEERRRLETQIKSVTGKSVTARYATDGGLLGGALVRVGSTVYDGSVRGQLERLKEQLIAG
ncbi:MAG: ATP synthase F1 subunit delta [Acidobacteria bacterium]|nr:MAG: ATP synthase F1 subunit delta [Acidobacteriota bacterium]